ncbi:5-oxoprolinase subunit PxpB [Reichenbachiella sp. MSK19-1]|uniref:5-oxoprolinase subunit PxpB n=1 Tax=Reichenbachiella sp. MSK19-1 TaxID=1897631 RepID=UPI000ECDAC16|nr:5-oxoprolinase subunit PxpB [Reichenbachiella sp. MSK19-1]RJE75384.1 hypothetical protein BGP76_12905 [Reichenbachiella sp. MSK19-1]
MKIKRYGDRAMLIEMKPQIDEAVNRQVHVLYHYLLDQKIVGVESYTLAYHSLTIQYNTKAISFEELTRIVRSMGNQDEMFPDLGKLFRIPVCYEAGFALDGEAVEEMTGVSMVDLITIHTQAVYHTYMIGFLPGFPYLGQVDERLAVGRKAKPSAIVPMGSVGLAGRQTGIYPCDSPGGWQVIGRTPIRMFESGAEMQGALLQAGDKVQFFPVSKQDYYRIDKDIESGNFDKRSLHVW